MKLMKLNETDRFSKFLCSGAQADKILLSGGWNWRMFCSWRSSGRWLGRTTRFVRANLWGSFDGSVWVQLESVAVPVETLTVLGKVVT